MKKVTMALMVALLSMVCVACSGPGDDAGGKLADILERHSAKVKDGTYDSEAFMSEALPVAREIRTIRQADSDRQLMMSQDVHDRYQAAIDGFKNAITEASESKDMKKMLGVISVGADFQNMYKAMGGDSGDEDYTPPAKTVKTADEGMKTAEEGMKTPDEGMKTADNAAKSMSAKE